MKSKILTIAFLLSVFQGGFCSLSQTYDTLQLRQEEDEKRREIEKLEAVLLEQERHLKSAKRDQYLMVALSSLLILLAFFIANKFSKTKKQSIMLKPFEFSKSDSKSSSRSGNMSYEKGILLLFLVCTIPSLIYSFIQLYQNFQIQSGLDYTEIDYGFFSPIYLVVGGVANIILLWVCFSIKLRRWSVLIIILVLLQAFSYLYWNFLNTYFFS